MTKSEKMSKGRNSKKRKAFTLIELLLAVFVLEIGLLGIAGFYAQSLTITKQARNQTTASNLATGVLEEQLAKSYDSPDLVSVSKTAYSTEPDNPFTNFQKQIDISCINADLITIACDTNAHMKKIVVTIFWQEQTQERSFQIATIKAEH